MQKSEPDGQKAVLDKRLKKLTKQAHKGSPSAKQFLHFAKSCDIENNLTEAVVLIRERAAQGDVDAQSMMGMLYEDGLGVAKDYKEAVGWYEKAVSQGHAVSQCILGVLYSNGAGVPKDEKKAMELYSLSAAQGNPSALLNLGLMYEDGEAELPKNEEKALELYEKAAQQGYAYAEYSFALLSENRGDYARAAEYYTRSAAKGHAPAQTNLGVMYEHGQHVQQDERMALRLYEQAAAQGDSAGLYNAALFHETGRGGIPPNPKTACEYFARSALKGDANAQVNYGYKLCVGDGVSKNKREGGEWFYKALLQQEKQGWYYMARLYSEDAKISTTSAEGEENIPNMTVEDMGRAFSYFRAAAQLGETRAIAWLEMRPEYSH